MIECTVIPELVTDNRIIVGKLLIPKKASFTILNLLKRREMLSLLHTKNYACMKYAYVT
jgi:hypothetical protein